MPGRDIRILLVDDSSADILLARALLSERAEWRFEVLVCTDIDTLETVHLRALGQFDAVLFGLSISGPVGVRLLRRLCTSLEQRPLVLCHEYFDPPELSAFAQAGVQAVLPKSLWSAETLSNTLAFAIEQARCRRGYGHDVLTGLPTRSVWLDRLMHVLDNCRRSNAPFAVMLIDLDDFKQVNDTLGHDAGDQLLRQIAQRLRHSVRHSDTVARLGGDEFAVLIEDLPYADVALQVARKLLADVCVPVHLARASIPVSISIGVAIMSPSQRQLTRDWVHQAADAALYAAKRAGKRNFSLYTDDMDRALLASLQLDEDIGRAVQREEFSLHYQPLMGLGDNILTGFEALLRWGHGPRQGVSPEVFLPVLQRLGLMPRVSAAIFQEALLQLRRWRDSSGRALAMHVNLSAAQVLDPQLPGQVAQAIDQAGLPADALVIELPEAALISKSHAIEAALQPLRARGVRFAICEFGMGQAITYLRAFRPDYIKLNRRPAQMSAESSVDAAIVRAHVVLSRELDIELIAEGIEHDQHLQALRALGEVSSVQGYLIGPPMLADTVEREYAPYISLANGEGITLAMQGVLWQSTGRLRTATA